jgi:hypothetical protein
MGRKKVDTILYKNSDFNDIAEECYVLLLQLKNEKTIDHVHLILDGTVLMEKEKEKGFLWNLFTTPSTKQDPFYKPYETVNIPIKNLALLPYSFTALLEEVKLQNPCFGDCHSLRVSVYPSERAHRDNDFNDLWVYTELLGETGEELDKLNHYKNHSGTNEGLTVYVSLPAGYEREFLKLERNLYKGSKKK